MEASFTSLGRNLISAANSSLEKAKGAISKPFEGSKGGPKGSKKPLEIHLKRLEAKKISLEATNSGGVVRLRLQDMVYEDFKEAMSPSRLVRLVLEQVIFSSLQVGEKGKS